MTGLLRRAARVVVRDPGEALDRVRNRIEARREHTAEPPPATREEIRARARERFGLEPDDGWEARWHALLGAPWPCPEHAAFAAVWTDLEQAFAAAARGAGSGLDADRALARALWCAVRHHRPERIVETGVSRGVTSRFLLEAIRANGAGHLWSIDLPPQEEDWREGTRTAVPAGLHGDWTFLRGSSRRHLPRLLRELGAVDVFIHDSQHTERNMRFELEAAWPRLRPGGLLAADDAHENAAVSAFAARHGVEVVVAEEERKGGLFALAVKPG
jgi:predicted O-methyltransferase YrrM